ncbi:MAG: DUF3524 domain-containing protein, partial [candidate division Zixibacteria bacterium]
MKILALEPFYGGSHKAFLDGWVSQSRHDWTIISLPARKWKWRMRHAAVTMADAVADRMEQGETFDLIFCSDMLNLSEFRGLVTEEIRARPSVVYFHENQLTYPNRIIAKRDYHFAFTNLTTSLCADEIWFNSQFHKEELLGALPRFWKRMPDFDLSRHIEALNQKSKVHSPGIENPLPRSTRKSGPVHIVWVARWEHDKNPADFFAALEQLKEQAVPFCLSILGEQYAEIPRQFTEAQDFFADEIINYGFQPAREAYLQTLSEADVVVSTAEHEFFGIAVVEAIAAGAYPLLPDRLSYPG